jgi:NAD(P)-dependent dehydrogenase (short-subunit alcohol dehydrogenase family)
MDGGGSIVNIASNAGIKSQPYSIAYCASKAGLLGLTRSLAAELAPRNIQVNAVCPGWVNTDMAWQGLDAFEGLTREQAYEVAMQEVPLRRMSEPDEIAGTVAWLLSADALGVTGQAIDHNNGAFMI